MAGAEWDQIMVHSVVPGYKNQTQSGRQTALLIQVVWTWWVNAVWLAQRTARAGSTREGVQ